MSELKARKANSFSNNWIGEYYEKSEADKVIEELKDEASTAHRVCSRQIQQIASNEQEIRHQKRKRCLAMAKWCEIGAQFQHNIVMQFDNPFYIKRAEWLEKWHNRWLELAEKFKEEK